MFEKEQDSKRIESAEALKEAVAATQNFNELIEVIDSIARVKIDGKVYSADDLVEIISQVRKGVIDLEYTEQFGLREKIEELRAKKRISNPSTVGSKMETASQPQSLEMRDIFKESSRYIDDIAFHISRLASVIKDREDRRLPSIFSEDAFTQLLSISRILNEAWGRNDAQTATRALETFVRILEAPPVRTGRSLKEDTDSVARLRVQVDAVGKSLLPAYNQLKSLPQVSSVVGVLQKMAPVCEKRSHQIAGYRRSLDAYHRK